jgi:hypothetical protein
VPDELWELAAPLILSRSPIRHRVSHTVQISVEVTAPKTGSCKVYWKVTDKAGRPYLPTQVPFGSM